MIPILKVLNEFTGGPCRDNINSIKNHHIKFNFYPILWRVLNDLNHAFYDVKSLLIGFLLALCEGNDRDLIKNLARNISPNNLENQIFKIVKKLYIRQTIRNDIYGNALSDEARETWRRTYSQMKDRDPRRSTKKLTSTLKLDSNMEDYHLFKKTSLTDHLSKMVKTEVDQHNRGKSQDYHGTHNV